MTTIVIVGVLIAVAVVGYWVAKQRKAKKGQVPSQEGQSE